MYAWLKGNTLDITGPTGYGFGITGNWTESTTSNFFTGQVAASYTATGTLELQTAAGDVALNVGAGSVAALTTAAQVNGSVFGTVSSFNLPVALNTGGLVSTFANAFGFNLNPLAENVTVDITMGGAAGVGLGNSTLLKATQAPLNNAILYLPYDQSAGHQREQRGERRLRSGRPGTLRGRQGASPRYRWDRSA